MTSKTTSAILRQLGVDIWEAADASIVIGGRGLRGLAAQEQQVHPQSRQFGDDGAHPDEPSRRNSR